MTAYYSARDNYPHTAGFADGSLTKLTYSSQGSKDYAKEEMDVYVYGRVLVIEDY